MPAEAQVQDTASQPSADGDAVLRARFPSMFEGDPIEGHRTAATAAGMPVPDHIKALRDSDADRRAFPNSYDSTAAGDFVDAIDTEGMTDAQKATIGREWAEMGQDLGASSADLGTILTAVKQGLRSTPEERARQREESVRRITQMYGKDAPQVIADARQLIARDPRFTSILRNAGVGDHPEAVTVLARLARSERAKGRLK
jgi:hypothetical protein